MLVKVGLAIALSVAAYIFTQLRSKPANRSDASAAFGNLEKKQQQNDDYKKEICAHSKVGSTQKNEAEEVKRVDSVGSSLSSKSLADDEQLLLPEFDDLLSEELEFPSENGASLKMYGGKEKQGSLFDSNGMTEQDRYMYEEAMANNASEIERLRSIVQELQQREENLESQLLEYYALKEQEISIGELQRRIRINAVENEMLNLKINSLEAQKRKVEEEVAEASIVKKELESARAMIKELQRQIQMETGKTKEQLLMLKQQVATLQDREKETSKKEFEFEKKLQSLKELEVEVVELRRTNKELQHEKRELILKLDVAEAQIASLLKMTETEMVEKAKEEASALRHANEDLSRQVEGLQINRFSEVEELVYLRWVNACLRYELRNYQAPSGKISARGLNKSLSPRSQERAKQLMLEYAGSDLLALREKEYTDNDLESVSSQTSTVTESGDFDDSSVDSTSSRQTSSKKSKLIQKLKRWGRSKDDSTVTAGGSVGERREDRITTSRKSPGHRHSISNGPFEGFISRHSSDSVLMSSLGTREDGPSTFAQIKSSHFPETHDATTVMINSTERGKFHMSRTIPEKDDLLNSVATSFQLMSRSVGRMHVGECPAFKDIHNLALQREKAIKEKAEQARTTKFSEKQRIDAITEGAKAEKPTLAQKTATFNEHPTDWQKDRLSEQQEVSKTRLAEIHKRAPRVAKAPPKPSTGSSSHSSALLKASNDISVSLPPPPPPPPPPAPPSLNGLPKLQGPTGDKVHRVPEVVEFYQSLVKREAKKESAHVASAESGNIADAQNNMIEEFENRSAFLLAVKADVETQSEFVQSLAIEVRATAFTNIKDVVAFVHWLDEELSFLVDERAVLKHFDWPEGKADALREAAFEYQDLQKLESEVASFVDDPRLSYDAALKQMYSLLETVEESLYALLRMRDMTIARYKDFGIPTYWLLDSGLVGKIKLACVKLARKYMTRVALELDAAGNLSDKEPVREFLLLQGVRFAFRVHQFAGGFDAESMQAFEDLRRRAHEQAKEAN